MQLKYLFKIVEPWSSVGVGVFACGQLNRVMFVEVGA